MRQFVIVTAFSLLIILLYQVYPIRLFKLDLPQRVTANLFNNFREHSELDTSIFILNTGEMTGSEIKTAVDALLTYNPEQIAILMCDINTEQSALTEAYRDNPKVILAECSKKDLLARLVYEDNEVTHFKTDNPNYVELKITNSYEKLKARNNELERINYYGSFPPFFHHNLFEVNQVNPDFFYRNTILIGYCGKSVDNSQFQSLEEPNLDYSKAHITPMNEAYGYDDVSPDMYDVQIVANIVKMIKERNFMNEAGNLVRVGFILICSLLFVGLITLIQTRWILVNLIIYALLFYGFVIAGTCLIVYCFLHDYYLYIPEYCIVLLLTGVFTILYNLLISRKRTAKLT